MMLAKILGFVFRSRWLQDYESYVDQRFREYVRHHYACNIITPLTGNNFQGWQNASDPIFVQQGRSFGRAQLR